MGRPSDHSPEVQERAVRLVQEARSQHDSESAAISSVAGKIGCTAETLRKWGAALAGGRRAAARAD